MNWSRPGAVQACVCIGWLVLGLTGIPGRMFLPVLFVLAISGVVVRKRWPNGVPDGVHDSRHPSDRIGRS